MFLTQSRKEKLSVFLYSVLNHNICSSIIYKYFASLREKISRIDKTINRFIYL